MWFLCHSPVPAAAFSLALSPPLPRRTSHCRLPQFKVILWVPSLFFSCALSRSLVVSSPQPRPCRRLLTRLVPASLASPLPLAASLAFSLAAISPCFLLVASSSSPPSPCCYHVASPLLVLAFCVTPPPPVCAFSLVAASPPCRYHTASPRPALSSILSSSGLLHRHCSCRHSSPSFHRHGTPSPHRCNIPCRRRHRRLPPPVVTTARRRGLQVSS